ncbi:MAG: glycoside hydrolase family 97 catalytic domain-containing protein, partial [Rhodothermales bacterium]
MKNLRVTTAVGAIRSGLSVLLLALVCAQCKPGTGDKPLRSPDGRIAVAVFVEDGVPLYRVERDGKAVLAASALGLRFRSALALDQDLAIVSTENRSFDETWVQPWGEQRLVRNRYNERRVRLRRTAGPSTEVDIVFRVFDDGVGFRYEVPDQSGFSTFELMDEHTEFNLADDLEAWWIPAYWWNRYEYLYQYTPVSQIDTVHTPLTLGKTGGPYLAIHEAALTDFASMTLVATGGTTLEADLVPWSDGVRVRGAAPLLSPWRTIQMSDTPGGLIESMLVLNLNEPNRIEDTSWIQPGKYVGIWWGMHIGKYTWASGPQHGATTANAKRHMDFAARHGFNGVLVEGWNLGWDGDWTANGALFDFTTPYPDFDIEEVTRYGAELGVELIGHHETGAGVENYERQLEDAFAYYRNLGVRTVKTGYVGWGQNILRTDEHGDEHREWHHGQYMVRHYRKVVETAARYGIMLDVHEPIKDTGIRRTYPNMMTREGARGQEYNAGWAEGGNPPEHETVVAFTRSLAGPFDFTPGIFRHRFPEYRPESGVPTTLARQLAQ